MGASLRRTSSEAYYQSEKELGNTKDLRAEPVIWESEHWLMIANRFPYDSVFKRHDMLIPKRDFAMANEMTEQEYDDLRDTLDSVVCEPYHLFFENSSHRRSNKSLFHLHLATYYDSREEFQL